MREKRDCWVCEKCGWAWLSASLDPPKNCPSRLCRSSKWNGIGTSAKCTITIEDVHLPYVPEPLDPLANVQANVAIVQIVHEPEALQPTMDVVHMDVPKPLATVQDECDVPWDDDVPTVQVADVPTVQQPEPVLSVRDQCLWVGRSALVQQPAPEPVHQPNDPLWPEEPNRVSDEEYWANRVPPKGRNAPLKQGQTLVDQHDVYSQEVIDDKQSTMFERWDKR